MSHPQRAEVGLMAAIIATIQFILVASIAWETHALSRAVEHTVPFLEDDVQEAAPTIALGRSASAVIPGSALPARSALPPTGSAAP